MWNIPTCWIEVRVGRHYRGVVKASNLFMLVRDRAILLGHGKHGKRPGWNPPKSLRGFPKDVSEEVKRDILGTDWDKADVTYYNLRELKDIDLNAPICVIEGDLKGELDDVGLNVSLMCDGETQEYLHIYSSVQNKVKESLRKKEPVNIELGRKEESRIGLWLKPWAELEYYAKHNKILDSDRGDEILESWEKVEGKLFAESKKREVFVQDLLDLIEFMKQFKGKNYHWLSFDSPVKEEDIRIIFWSPFGSLNLKEEIKGLEPKR